MKKIHGQVAGFAAVAAAAVLAFVWSPTEPAHSQQTPLAAADISTAVMGAGPAPAGLLRTSNEVDPFDQAKRSAPADELPAQF